MKMRPEHGKKAVAVLGKVAPFSSLSPQKLEQLVSSDGVVLKEFSAGQQVFPCRSVSGAIGVLLSGECRTLSDKTIVSVENEGALFGTTNLYSKGGAAYHSEAAGVCRVLFISYGVVDMLVEESSDFARSYIAMLSERVIKLEARVHKGSKDRALGAFAEYLLSRPRSAAGEVSLPKDMLRLSKQLGLDKAALFKAIEVLNSEGTITFNGSAVCITDEEKLKKHA